ncbi:MAG: O-antigen ligase family protein [Ktedonobacteraceae bacterium]
MQISKAFPHAAFPPSGEGGAPENADQMRLEQMRHRRIQLLRSVQIWWYPISLAVFGAIVAAILGQFAFDLPKEIIGGIIAAPAIFLTISRNEVGLVILAVCVSPFTPSALKVSSLYISPAIPILLLLFFLVVVRKSFHVKENFSPSLWTTWPLITLILLAIVSEMVGQLTWLYGVPHQVLGNPIAFEEAIGIALYCIPLLIVWTVTAVLTKKDKWVKYIQYTFLILSLLDAGVMIFEFRHVGADIYSFRYASPSIGWMPLEALAQLLVLGCIIAYAHFLYATQWKMRIVFGIATLLNLLALYLSLENSWWLEGAVALAVITIVYSRRLFVFFCIAGLPVIPAIHAFLQKLSSVKSVDSLRFVIWQDILRAWSKRPVLGVGPGNLWAYDQTFSHLPQGLRNFALSGLGVAHEGYLQTLGELGPLGLFCQVSFIVIVIIAAARLFRRSRAISTTEMRQDRILGLVGLGLICGSAAGDLVASYFFLPPRQSLHVASLPQAMASWIIYSCVLYKDQLWRLARRGLRIGD